MACAGPEPHAGASAERARCVNPVSPSAGPAAAPRRDVAAAPSFLRLCLAVGPARGSEVGRRKLAAGRGGAQLAEEGVKLWEAAG